MPTLGVPEFLILLLLIVAFIFILLLIGIVVAVRAIIVTLSKKPCPYCGEPTRRKAILCRYCGRSLVPTSPPSQNNRV